MLTSILLLVVVFVVSLAFAKQDCTVCERVIEDIEKTLTSADKKDMLKVEEKIVQFCKKADKGEARYSIETVKRKVSRPLMNGVPSDVLCKRLAKKDAEICAINEGGGVQKVDLATIDPATMSVKQMKKVLAEYDMKCVGCTDKDEFRNKVKLLLEQHAKSEL